MSDLFEWLSEEAPWAVGHLRMRIGPERHWDEAAKALLDKCSEAAAEIAALRARVADLEAKINRWCDFVAPPDAPLAEIRERDERARAALKGDRDD